MILYDAHQAGGWLTWSTMSYIADDNWSLDCHTAPEAIQPMLTILLTSDPWIVMCGSHEAPLHSNNHLGILLNLLGLLSRLDLARIILVIWLMANCACSTVPVSLDGH